MATRKAGQGERKPQKASKKGFVNEALDDAYHEGLKKALKKEEPNEKHLVISAPHFLTASFLIRGTTPYVQNKFSARQREGIHITQSEGSTTRKDKKRVAKDFKACYEEAIHKSAEGW